MFGIYGHSRAAAICYYGLHCLQHRGQEGAGIVTVQDGEMMVHKGEGLINEVFNEQILNSLKGNRAISHVRYSNGGGGGAENVEPLVFRAKQSSMAITHDGSLENADELRDRMEEMGSIFQTNSDSEVLAHLIRRSMHTQFVDKVKESLRSLVGGFAFMVLTENQLIAASDPWGLRPLSVGRLKDGYVVTSETCAFDIVGARWVRDVKPGEMIIIDDEGLHAEPFVMGGSKNMCAMEYIYFARPDSDLNGINVHTARKRLGKQLAKEAPVDADIVVGVPDSSISAAIGYAEQSGIPYEMGLIKNKYVGRTFIQPSQELREQGVKMKLSAVRGVVENKRVVIVDDSIVRGTTIKRIITLLREAGALEVHVRISSPPLKYTCPYGIDLKTSEELLAANYDQEEIRKMLGMDSLAHISVEGLVEAVGTFNEDGSCGQCRACFNGSYPTHS